MGYHRFSHIVSKQVWEGKLNERKVSYIQST